MHDFVIPKPKLKSLPTLENGEFPVRRVYCIGRNYADHAIEMGHDPNKEEPFFFQKNPENLVSDGIFPLPKKSGEVHYEIELLVALKSGGSKIGISESIGCVWGYAVSLDMTLRDLQKTLKQLQRPWEISKAFEYSAPVGILVSKNECGTFEQGRIQLEVNGKVQQEGNLNQMIWKIPEIISYLSNHFTLAGGDVILTGTPAGVNSVNKGDRLKGFIEGLPELKVGVI